MSPDDICTHPRALTDHDHSTEIGLTQNERCRCADCGARLPFARVHRDEHASVVVTYPGTDRSDYVIATLHRSTRWAVSDLLAWSRSARKAGYSHLTLQRTPCDCRSF